MAWAKICFFYPNHYHLFRFILKQPAMFSLQERKEPKNDKISSSNLLIFSRIKNLEFQTVLGSRQIVGRILWQKIYSCNRQIGNLFWLHFAASLSPCRMPTKNKEVLFYFVICVYLTEHFMAGASTAVASVELALLAATVDAQRQRRLLTRK